MRYISRQFPRQLAADGKRVGGISFDAAGQTDVFDMHLPDQGGAGTAEGIGGLPAPA